MELSRVEGDRDMVETKTSPHYVAYFDVLGYTAYLKNEDNDEQALFQAVKRLMSTVTSLTDDISFKTEGFKSRTFSDNILLAVEVPEGDDEVIKLHTLVLLAGSFQYVFLKNHDLMLRGSIAYGDLFLDEDFVFGKGLISAVEAEKKAGYPRIIIDESVIKRAGDQVTSLRFVSKDDDGSIYIDWLQYAEKEVSSRFGATSEAEELRIIKRVLESRIRKYCRFQNNTTKPETIANREKVITKHLWMIEKYNAYCVKNGYEELILQYEPKLNKKLMKYELKVV